MISRNNARSTRQIAKQETQDLHAQHPRDVATAKLHEQWLDQPNGCNPAANMSAEPHGKKLCVPKLTHGHGGGGRQETVAKARERPCGLGRSFIWAKRRNAQSKRQSAKHAVASASLFGLRASHMSPHVSLLPALHARFFLNPSQGDVKEQSAKHAAQRLASPASRHIQHWPHPSKSLESCGNLRARDFSNLQHSAPTS